MLFLLIAAVLVILTIAGYTIALKLTHHPVDRREYVVMLRISSMLQALLGGMLVIAHYNEATLQTMHIDVPPVRILILVVMSALMFLAFFSMMKRALA